MFTKSSSDFPANYLLHQLQTEEMSYVENKIKVSSPKITRKKSKNKRSKYCVKRQKKKSKCLKVSLSKHDWPGLLTSVK